MQVVFYVRNDSECRFTSIGQKLFSEDGCSWTAILIGFLMITVLKIHLVFVFLFSSV